MQGEEGKIVLFSALGWQWQPNKKNEIGPLNNGKFGGQPLCCCAASKAPWAMDSTPAGCHGKQPGQNGLLLLEMEMLIIGPVLHSKMNCEAERRGGIFLMEFCKVPFPFLRSAAQSGQ